MKKLINFLAISSLLLLLATGCGCEKKKDQTNEESKIETNTNEDVIKDQEVDVFKFTNTSLIYENNNSKLQTTVTNTSDEIAYLSKFLIHVYGEDGNEIVTLTGFVGDSIDAKASKVVDNTYGEDLTKATKIEYEVVK